MASYRQLLSHKNTMQTRWLRNPLDSVLANRPHWLKALNTSWYALREELRSAQGDELGDKLLFVKMAENCLDAEDKRALLHGPATRAFYALTPRVMDITSFPRATHDPCNPDPSDVTRAQAAHQAFCEKFNQWGEDIRSTRLATNAVAGLARALYVVRCNLNHCGKFPNGPDREKVERDRAVAKLASQILAHMLSLLIKRPNTRLASYGTLRPGGANHQALSSCEGTWIQGTMRGAISHQDQLPLFDWNVSGDEVSVDVLTSSALVDKWEELDSFEGNLYSRARVPVTIQDGSAVVATVYVRKPSGREVWA